MEYTMTPRALIVALIGAGMTQQQIAERVGLCQSSVSKLLTGRCEDVMSVTYRALVALHADVMAEAARAPA